MTLPRANREVASLMTALQSDGFAEASTHAPGMVPRANCIVNAVNKAAGNDLIGLY